MRFFKIPKNQQFNYKPRYYNQQKEDLEARLRAARQCDKDDVEAMKARISGSFRQKYKEQRGTHSKNLLRRNLLLIGIIVFLFCLTYAFLIYYLPRIVEVLG
ncbi:MAG TPA: hypothetical protein ENJ45_00265 [Phaeodactylibacter sp.]|nr:hypothetical protein [Phaeodactylibacter sp.]